MKQCSLELSVKSILSLSLFKITLPLSIEHIISLAVVQALTEFLPVSSSAHLILFPMFMGWEDQGLVFDVSLHIGTLLAVLLYFRLDLQNLLKNCLNSGNPIEITYRENSTHLFPKIKIRPLPNESRLVWGILLATIPAGIMGLIITGFNLEESLRKAIVIASTTMIFGLLLGWADLTGRQQRNEHSLTWSDILIIGIAQAVALIPGTSRSGITITVGLLLGLQRQAAARFSFLLSIPAIILAGGGDAIKCFLTPSISIDGGAILLGMGVSALTAYLCIYSFMKLLAYVGMWPFVLYRLGLAAVLWIWVV